MDLLQITVIVVLIILTIIVSCVGVYLTFVLKELRETVKKTNAVIDGVQKVTNVFSNPMAIVAEIVSGVIDGFKAVKSVGSIFDKPKKGGK
jgi:hypothetical protein